MSITFKELIKNHPINDIPIEHQHNLEELLLRINKIRQAWGKAMIVTSGYRSKQDHIRIYSQINSKRKAQGLDLIPIPTGSAHLSGCAVDIYDPGLELTKWLKSNPEILENVELWCEEGNSNWVHFQIYPPKSGQRWFLP